MQVTATIESIEQLAKQLMSSVISLNTLEKFVPLNRTVLSASKWAELESISPRDIKRAVVLVKGSISKFALVRELA